LFIHLLENGSFTIKSSENFIKTISIYKELKYSPKIATGKH